MDTAQGRYWLSEPDHPGKKTSACELTGICGGGAGIVLFFLQMAHATGEVSYLDDARRGADYLASVWPNLLSKNIGPSDANLSFYHGIAGIAFALSETGRAVMEPRYQQAALAATDAVTQPMQTEAGWTDPAHTADLALYLLYAARTFHAEKYRALAMEAGLRLVAMGKPHECGGMNWQNAGITSADNTSLAAEDETAHVAFALARLFEEAADPTFLHASLEGAAHVQSVVTGSGSLISYTSANFLSASHPEFGPAITGRARLFYQLYKVTGTDCYRERAEALANAAIRAEESVRHTPNSWETVRQSSGAASLLDLLLDLAAALGNVEYVEIAASLASRIVEQNTDFDGKSYVWDQRFPWIIPSALSAQTGYLTGAAGIGAALAHVALAQRGGDQPFVFPDSPFSDSCKKLTIS
jgi:lantibiotic modifying enzyme